MHPYRGMLLEIDFPEIEPKMAKKIALYLQINRGNITNIFRLKKIHNNK
jgi:hypothetical protein